MPHYMVTSMITALNRQRKPLNGSKILIWGVAYKKDINDPREGAVYDVVPNLIRKGAQVDYFDPYIPQLIVPAGNFMINNREPLVMKSAAGDFDSLKKYDAVMILTDHSGFDYEELARNAALVVDTRNAVKSRDLPNVYHC